ncbi:hypothetical protein K469DRAFT_278461 [Zopfia rhizophila CBS 207.26]|uniref:Uncharacterized protein n=1 Tax=Zopfia rhizophila CBS 207.26 TaxID=1314779 RepID=A0A6A6DPU2_9PEZI|nr:hypothetical protein K469DRAFT_278461 [Zopfia rhizophila CBS 207.26]
MQALENKAEQKFPTPPSLDMETVQSVDARYYEDPKVQELQRQIEEERQHCETLKREIDRKDAIIKGLEGACKDAENRQIQAVEAGNEKSTYQWQEKFERLKTLWQKTREEREGLHDELEKARQQIWDLEQTLNRKNRELNEKNDEMAAQQRSVERLLSERDDEIAHLQRRNERQLLENADLQRRLLASPQNSSIRPTSSNLPFPQTWYDDSSALNRDTPDSVTNSTHFTKSTNRIMNDDRIELIPVAEGSTDPPTRLNLSGNRPAEEAVSTTHDNVPSHTQSFTQTRRRKEQASSQPNPWIQFAGGKKFVTLPNLHFVSKDKPSVVRD